MTLNDTIRIAGTVEESIVDGPGLRYVLFTQGCPHRCPGCHNPETHPFDGGRVVTLDWVVQDVIKNPITRGVTFSGGEPFSQSGQLVVLGEELKRRGYNLVAFSGYCFEELADSPRFRPLLELLDILVDGPFILAERPCCCVSGGRATSVFWMFRLLFRRESPYCILCMADFSRCRVNDWAGSFP